MKKLFFSRCALAIGVMLVCSCVSKDNYVQEKVPDLFSIDMISLDPLGSASTLTFTSETDWTATADGSWLEISPSSGRAGTYTLTLSARINSSWEDRTANLILNGHSLKIVQSRPFVSIDYRGDGLDDIQISGAVQPGMGRYHGGAEIDFPWNQSISAGRAGMDIVVSSNVAWELTLEEGFDSTFFSIDDKTVPDTYLYESTVGKSAKALPLVSARNNFMEAPLNTLAKIRASEKEGVSRAELDNAVGVYDLAISQDNLIFLINGQHADTLSVSFDELGYLLDDNGKIRSDSTLWSALSVECEIPWTAEYNYSDLDISVSGDSGGVSEEGVVDVTRMDVGINRSFNPETVERQLDIRLSAASGEAVKVIRVYQKPYIFSFNEDEADLEFENGETDYHTIRLATTGSWEVRLNSGNYEWLEIDPSQVRGKSSPGRETFYYVRFRATRQNLHMVNDDNGELIFTAANGLRRSIPVSQLKYQLFADYDEKALRNLSATRLQSEESHPMTIYSSGPWTILGSDGKQLPTNSWYSLSRIHSSSSVQSVEEIRVGSGQANSSLTQSRAVTILITSDFHEHLSSSEQSRYGYKRVSVELRQRPFTFSVNGVTPGGNQTVVLAGYKTEFTDYLDIQSDGKWSFENLPSWLHPQVTSSNSNANVMLNPDLNISTESREATITVRCTPPWGTLSPVSITVRQDPITFNISANSGNPSMKDIDAVTNFAYNGSILNSREYGFTVTASDELPWRYSTSSSSAFISTQDKYAGNDSFVIVPATNSGSARNMAVYVYPDYESDPRISRSASNAFRKTFEFSQKAFVFDDTEESSVSLRSVSDLTPSKQYSIESSGPWSVYSPGWIKLVDSRNNEVISGISSQNGLKLQASPNTEMSGRNGTVEIRSEVTGRVKRIRVSQDKYYYELVSSSSMSFDAFPTSAKNLTFRSSGNWKLEAEGWVIDPAYASGNGDDSGKTITVQILPKDNTAQSGRSGNITIVSSYGSFSLSNQKVSLTQDGYVFSVDKSGLEFNSPFAKSVGEQTVNVTCPDWWDAETSADWIELKNASKRGNGSFTVSVTKDNLSLNKRTGTVKVTSTHNGVKTSVEQYVTVSQDAYVLSVSNPPVVGKSGGTVEVPIKCSGNWEVIKVSDSGSIISSFSPSSGKGDGKILFKVKRGTRAEKSATFKIKCEGSESLTTTIRITRKG